MKIILTGGGTGGHVYPAIAIKELIRKHIPGSEFLYIGIKNRAEEHILGSLEGEEKISLAYIKAIGLPRQFSPLQYFRFFTSLISGIFSTLKIMKEFSPDLIIATGGYVTAPVIISGRLKRKRMVIHEQNNVPGLVNKFLGRFVDKILLTFSESEGYFDKSKTVLTGYPVRNSIRSYSKEEARKKLDLPEKAHIVFIFGGSSGAKNINETVASNLDRFLSKDDLIIYHGTGKDNETGYKPYTETLYKVKSTFPDLIQNNRYICVDYCYNIDHVYAAADLVICRAGAGTIMECASIGKPVILVPKSGLPGDHQVHNADFVKNKNGAEVVYEEKIDGHYRVDGIKLSELMIELCYNSDKLNNMSTCIKKIYTPDTENMIIDEIKKLTN